MSNRQPNFVLIMCDQQRREHLGCYGSKAGATPNLNRLAANALIFDNAYTYYPVCTPARGAVFTGRTPRNCGAYANELPLYETVPTMGEIFRDAGYRTGYIGKWHLDGAGYMGSGNAARGFPDAVWYDGKRYLDELGPELAKIGYGNCTTQELRERDISDETCWATRNSNRAIDFLQNSQLDDSPFMLVVSYDEPHPPAVCPKRFLDRIDMDQVEIPETLTAELGDKPTLHRMWQTVDKEKYNVTPNTIRDGIHRYLACNAYVDHEIGRVLDAVDNYADNTVVIYTVDHGDFCGDFGLTGKGPAMYDAITRVPLIIREPNSGALGARTSALASTMDLLPTMLELADADCRQPMDGVSLVAARRGTGARETVCMGFDRFSINQAVYGGFCPVRAIRDKRWKLVITIFGEDELYDLENDSDECINRINDPVCAEVRDRLHGQLLAELNRVKDILRGDPVANRPWRQAASPERFTIA